MDGVNAKLKMHHRLQSGLPNPEVSPSIPIKVMLGMSLETFGVVILCAAGMGPVIGVGLAGQEDIDKRSFVSDGCLIREGKPIPVPEGWVWLVIGRGFA